MRTKLDPVLTAMVGRDGDNRGRDAQVDVLVSLDRPLDARMRADLVAGGLSVRSVLGKVVTGSVRVRDLDSVERIPCVVEIAASAPLDIDRSR